MAKMKDKKNNYQEESMEGTAQVGMNFNSMLKNMFWQGFENKKVFKTIPQSSVIGLLLEETNNYQIIQSDAISILQHDPFTWCVENGDFIYLKQNDQLSKHTQSTLSNWLKSIDVNTRKQVIDTIYSIFSDYENPKDLRKNINIAEMIKSIHNMDDQTKKMISETIQVLFKCIQNEIKRGN